MPVNVFDRPLICYAIGEAQASALLGDGCRESKGDCEEKSDTRPNEDRKELCLHESLIVCELLLNLNIAARERATGGITVAQPNVERVGTAVAVIGHTHAVGNLAAITHPGRSSEVGAVASEGQGADLSLIHI